MANAISTGMGSACRAVIVNRDGRELPPCPCWSAGGPPTLRAGPWFEIDTARGACNLPAPARMARHRIDPG
ncbi:MAG: hypothetical protein AB2807_05310 [Candidatus Sedimenticola endophacoides]